MHHEQAIALTISINTNSLYPGRKHGVCCFKASIKFWGNFLLIIKISFLPILLILLIMLIIIYILQMLRKIIKYSLPLCLANPLNNYNFLACLTQRCYIIQ